MTNISPIETAYAGHRFRSRLEARWAVFFDAYGVKWLYEPQGYDIGGTWYLPDFWLPDFGLWVEVKGRLDPAGWQFLRDAIWTLPAKPELPGRYHPTPSLLLVGAIPGPEHAGMARHVSFEWGIGGDRKARTAFQYASFGSPTGPTMRRYGPMYDASTVDDPQALLASAPLPIARAEAAEHAFARARRARFEHGERG